jgi:hypothetical protein
MTREEAASIIEDRVRVTEYVESSYVDCVDIEALKMAIEALKGKDTNVPSRKGVFIPYITVELFRNAPLAGVEELIANGEMEDISLPPAQPSSSCIHENDSISRQAAIDALAKHEKSKGHNYTMFVDVVSECAEIIRDLPPAQPRLNKKRISDLLWNEYRTMSPHLSAEGVVARRYYCKELWKELFGEEETPVWMTW